MVVIGIERCDLLRWLQQSAVAYGDPPKDSTVLHGQNELIISYHTNKTMQETSVMGDLTY
jgi:hypothetical protein